MIYSLAKVITEYFNEQKISYMHILKGMQICFFALECIYSEKTYYLLHKRLEEFLKSEVYIGIVEHPIRDVWEINEAISLAEQIAISSYYNENIRVRWFSEKIQFQEHNPRGIKELLDVMNNKVQNFQKQDTIRLIHGIFSKIFEHKYIQINVLRRIFMDMLGIYSMSAQMLNGTIESIYIDDDNCHYQKLMHMNSMACIENWFLEFEDLFYEKFFIAYKCNQSDILKNVISYLHENIEEQIYLKKTAEKVGVSGTYLSTIFKKEIGINFVDYVNQIKVNAAKQMLENGKMVYETAECLGYENSTYFSKVFKKYTGISPDSYRKNDVIK